MRVFTAILTGLGALFSVEAFAENDVLLGTGLGAAMGAVVGHQIDHNNGAWVGGAVGAVTGAAIASNNNSTRYVAGDPYYAGYNTYDNTPRRDVYVVEPDYYYQRPPQRPPVNVIYVDGGRGHQGHHRRYDDYHERRHHGHGYSNHGRNNGQTVVIVR